MTLTFGSLLNLLVVCIIGAIFFAIFVAVCKEWISGRIMQLIGILLLVVILIGFFTSSLPVIVRL